MLMSKRLKSSIVLAALLGALGASHALAAGPKVSGTRVIVDDFTGGSGGSVGATAGTSVLDGGLGQVSTIISEQLAPGATVEAGFFGALVLPPASLSIAEINASSISFAWSDTAPPNPIGTLYAMDVSTDSTFAGTLISSGSFGLSGVVAGLKGNTSYYSRIGSGYAESDDSPLTAFGLSVTKAQAPAGALIADAAPFTLKAVWDALGNTGGDLTLPWSASASTLPAVRQGHAALFYGGRLYVSGGVDTVARSTVWTAPVQGDGSIGAWTTTTPLPAARESHAMAAWGGRLYVAGGSDGAARATVWWAPIRADGTLGAWTATVSLPAVRMKLAMSAWGGQLVVTGGDNGVVGQSTVYSSRINDDGTLNGWTTAAQSLPAAVSGHGMAVSSGTLYVSGGTGAGIASTVWWSVIGATGPGAWTATTPLPVGLTRHAMAAAHGKLYIAGGSDGLSEQSAVYVGQLAADRTVSSWGGGTPLPSTLFLSAMTASMDRLYFTGGFDGAAVQEGVLTTLLSGTQYLAEAATDAGFSTAYSSSDWRAGTSFDFSGLTPNTAYFSRVSARNYAGAPTTGFILGSTRTLAAMPGAPVSTFTSVQVGSITFQWTSGGNPAGTEYIASVSTASDFSGTVLLNDWLTAATTCFKNLAVNTSYYARVQARNSLATPTPFTLLGSTYTLASVPVLSTITASNASGLTLWWQPGLNPSWTRYEAQVATMTTFSTLLQSSVTSATTAYFTGLVSASTFYARVRALNGNGVPSAFDLVVSTATGLDAVPPGIATGTFAQPGGTVDGILAGWVVPGDDGYTGTLLAGAQFSVQWSTSDPASVAWSPGNAQVAVTTGPLTPGASASFVISSLPSLKRVYFRVWTRDQAGNFSVQSATFSAVAVPTSFETIAGGGGFDAGRSPSLAVDRSGNLHVAYQGTTATQELQYAKRTAGIWGTPVSLDPGVVVSNVVLALDTADNPVIAYYDTAAPQLKLARFNAGWTISTLEPGSFAPGGLVIDAAGGAAISYYDTAAGDLKYGIAYGAVWSTTTVDAGAADTGRESALALDASQQPHISYYDATNMALKYASATIGGVWSLQTVDSGVNVGTANVIALDGFERAHIAYGDVTNQTVKYASATAAGGWSIQVVEPNSGGLRLGLALGGAGAAHVSYRDQLTGALKTANWAGAAFSTFTVDGSADVGVESSLAIDGAGNSHVAYRDTTNRSLKILHYAGGAIPAPFGGNARGRAQGPSAMSRAVLTLSSIQWSWTDNASNELGYRLYGSLVSTGPFTQVAGTETITASAGTGGVKSYIETGLTAGTTYFRYAVAVGSGGFSPSSVVSTVPFNTADAAFPTIVNNQAGDDVWRRSNSGVYDVDFFDTGGSMLSRFQVKVSTVSGGAGPDLIAYTDVVTGIGADVYTTNWPLPSAVFLAMRESATNYVTIKVLDGFGNAAVAIDAFYVLKDTTAPLFVNNQPNDPIPRMTDPGPASIWTNDGASTLASFQYSVSSEAATGNAAVIAWTDIAALAPGTTFYENSWPVDFANLFVGATNYVSVRAWDVAGSTRVLVDAYFLIKVAGGPLTTVNVPPSAPYVSTVAVFSGTAFGEFGVKGVELSFAEAGLYWSGAAFISATPVWYVANGTASWSLNPGITWVDQSTYSVIARSSDTGGNYSAVYATRAFSTDFQAPTSGVTTPANSSVISAIASMNGVSSDPGGIGGSGVASVELRLRRLSDGLWWSFTAETWSGIAIATSPTGTTAWSLTPSATLRANLANAASYYLQVRALDNAVPANAGSFFDTGSSTFTFSDVAPPADVVDLSTSPGATPGTLNLSWTAPGDDGAVGIIVSGQYRIQYSTFSPVTYSTTAAQVVIATGPVTPGSAQATTITGLSPGATYFIGLWTRDSDDNWSGLSNLTTGYAAPSPSDQIRGHVVQISSVGITAVQIDCYDAGGALQSTAFTQADGSGTFVLNGVPAGAFKVQASWSANGVGSSVWIDNIPVGTIDLDFVLQLDFLLATLQGNLQTLSAAAAGNTQALGVGARVSAFFDPKALPSVTVARVELYQFNRQVGMVPVQTGGHWYIPNLLPGRYQVRAFNGVEYTDFQTVDLIDGEIKTLDFQYDPLPENAVFAFPNPARRSTTLRFLTTLLPVEAHIRIFDVAGSLVKELSIADGSIVAAPIGSGASVYHATWDLTNTRGASVASGVYLFAVKVKGGSANQTAMVIKKVAVVK